ncbi:SLC13 family permease [Desulfitobacterium sp. PCE1]|uniref:SLC13 family permease n=1 Tax=Desulfitobacterium sp. PCE1 TaxID=146907 RepID=UPI0003A61225|nr:SLC13 family permease [Desulfitobacterium sp. PCE1]
MLESLISTKLLLQLSSKLVILFSLVLIVISANKAGLIGLLTKPFGLIKNQKTMLLAWFIFSCAFSPFFPNSICATILVPIALIYAENRNINKTALILTLGTSIIVGNNFLPTGGGGNLMAWGLLENRVGHDLSSLVWLRMMFVPTLISAIISLFVLWKMVYSKLSDTLNNDISSPPKITPLFIVNSILFAFGIYAGLFKLDNYYLVADAVIMLIINRPDKSCFSKLPYKALLIYSIAMIVGSLTGQLVKANPNFTDILTIDFSFLHVFLISILSAFSTNLIDNGAVTAILIPSILSFTEGNNFWLWAFLMNTFNVGFATIFANTVWQVSCSYGLKQKDLFKVGFVLAILHVMAFSIYFYIMQGSNVFTVL